MAQSNFDKFEIVSADGTATDITAFVKNLDIDENITIDVKVPEKTIPYQFEAVLNLEFESILHVGDPVDFVGENDESYPYFLKEIRADGMYIFEPRKD